jgi:hypothetical protein
MKIQKLLEILVKLHPEADIDVFENNEKRDFLISFEDKYTKTEVCDIDKFILIPLPNND